MEYNVNWRKILDDLTTKAENDFELIVSIEMAIVKEVQEKVHDALAKFKEPNAAKIAGIVAFWIRRLKPLRVEKESLNAFLLINEFLALKVGLAICEKYFDDSMKQKITLNPRILRDWVFSFRYNSHSPHSSLISFEMLACEGKPDKKK